MRPFGGDDRLRLRSEGEHLNRSGVMGENDNAKSDATDMRRNK